MKRDGVEALSDLALARAIRDLSVRLERLDRDASPRALVHGCYLQAALDAALAERDRRRAEPEGSPDQISSGIAASITKEKA